LHLALGTVSCRHHAKTTRFPIGTNSGQMQLQMSCKKEKNPSSC
jgi:hypothetical protein